ncbi:MAG: hemolysin family protein [Bdellovibrionota bacterium]
MHDSNPMLVILGILASLTLVALNGFFVAAEFAIVKVRRTRLEELAGMGVASARVSILCVDKLDEYLSATQLGITLVSLALGWIGEAAFANLLLIFVPAFRDAGGGHHVVASVISFFTITLLHVVLGELVPKSMAIQNAEKMALRVSKPLRLFYKVSKPLIWAFNSLAVFVLHRLGYAGFEEPPLTEQELKLVMKESREEGVITESEAQIINRAFGFADKRAADIMIHAEVVDYISMARPLDQNLVTIRRHMHTRFPLCEKDFDTVLGTVHMKDVWPLLLSNFSNEAFSISCRPATFVDSNVRQDQLLKILQGKRGHLAIVQDPQSKKNIGIVTLEDVLEDLVGDIQDEHGN